MNKIKRIYIISPCYATGGTELNHQLVNELNIQGQESYICYIPFGQHHQCPDQFRIYTEVRSAEMPDDEQSNLIIIPESLTKYTILFKDAKLAIWWQSVDNYFSADLSKPYISIVQKWRSLLTRKRVRLGQLKKYEHFCQSYYAQRFLRRYNINASMLGDYINLDPTQARSHVKAGTEYERRNMILYNPKKGYNITSKLILANVDFEFVPLIGLPKDELHHLFNEAKIYIDFGNHPGKDRLPREAAINNCVVITGIHGSSKYSEDLPISTRYKIDTNSKEFNNSFRELISDVFSDYRYHLDNQEDFRIAIRSQNAEFRSQVSNLLIPTNPTAHDRFA
jgi:hypothetical protein